MKRGIIKLYDNQGEEVDCQSYQNFEDRLGIINYWKGKGAYYQISPETQNLILKIIPSNVRGKILLNELNKAS
jgi:hypothetical protein